MRAPPLPRWPATWPSAWVAPLVLAAAWSIALANEPELTAQRGLVFAGGPFVLLAGLHARLGGYLHAPERERLLPLPIEPARHFQAARPAHRRGLALTIVAGIGAIAAATLPDVARCGWLLADFLWLALAAILIEPGIAGVAAYAGRRFPPGHWITEAQRFGAGGWTAEEAAVHLYAPALGVGLATLVAMPGQLTLARLAERGAATSQHWTLLAAPMLAALIVRVTAGRLYAAGLWEAVPWLAEATRRLAGTGLPAPRPGFVAHMHNPVLQLGTTQLLRLCPLMRLRLVALLLASGWLAVRAGPPDAPRIALWCALAALWLSPLQVLARERRRNAALLASLPLPAPERSGRLRGLEGLLLAPPAVLAAFLFVRWL
ncbi:hypothetical protein [Nannocystis punicea]|uniref:Uncharacterized protein n=1 Tax=Nannocystis punicea TaxID=2995304 RepID=A0ABY7HIV5_9BACT|nr:hypothetical protein [Nannocystis poenicansa]WAS98799.1 hypothetical protein O0S08_21925 [Nannocystis poenicansa]